MRKKLLIIISLFILLSFNSVYARVPVQLTFTASEGWSDFSYEKKEGLVLGIYEADIMKRGSSDASSFKWSYYILRGEDPITLEEVVENINKFYSDPRNERIPVIVAIEFVVREIRAYRPNEFDADLEKVRNEYNQMRESFNKIYKK